jgi:catalase
MQQQMQMVTRVRINSADQSLAHPARSRAPQRNVHPRGSAATLPNA